MYNHRGWDLCQTGEPLTRFRRSVPVTYTICMHDTVHALAAGGYIACWFRWCCRLDGDDSLTTLWHSRHRAFLLSFIDFKKKTPVESHGPFVGCHNPLTIPGVSMPPARLLGSPWLWFLGGSLAALAPVEDGCGSLEALVDVRGDCCYGSLVDAGEGSCDWLIADQSCTTARQQKTAGPCWCTRVAYSTRTVYSYDTQYIRT